ncbi:MAG: peptidylprolyl isomerase [Xanthomonadales bacterium]|nr:peptidylprolyl isomerase [Xanthomonadales bacterium]
MLLFRLLAALLAGSSALIATIVTAQGLPGAPSTVLAQQGNVQVTIEDIDAFAQGMPEAQRAGFFGSPTRIESLVSSMLLQKQLAQEARALGADKEPAVEKQVEQAVDAALAKARMARFRADLTLPDFRTLAKEDFIAHKEKYRIPEKVDVKHVLISTKDRSVEQASAIADGVRNQAIAHPDQFDALVEEYSDDPSKSGNHGLMTDAGDSRKYVPEFAAAAKKLKRVGEISPVVKTAFGFHVLKLVERAPARTPSFEEAQDAIVSELRSTFIEKEAQKHTDTLRNRPIEANAELMASLRSRYGTGEVLSSPAE